MSFSGRGATRGAAFCRAPFCFVVELCWIIALGVVAAGRRDNIVPDLPRLSEKIALSPFAVDDIAFAARSQEFAQGVDAGSYDVDAGDGVAMPDLEDN